MTIERLTGLDAAHLGFDELVASDADIHIERMDRDHIWMAIRSAGRTVSLHFYGRHKAIRVIVEAEPG